MASAKELSSLIDRLEAVAVRLEKTGSGAASGKSYIHSYLLYVQVVVVDDRECVCILCLCFVLYGAS